MTVGRLERSVSLSIIHDVVLGGETVPSVERRRRNGLGNIFQGLSQNDINELRSPAKRLNWRSSSCPCSGSNFDNSNDSRTRHSTGKRKYHLLHSKRLRRRRMALGDIFTGIPHETVTKLMCKTIINRIASARTLSSEDTLKDSEDNLNLPVVRALHQRRFALADIFAGIPQDKVSDLGRVMLAFSGEESLIQDSVRFNSRRRCALGDIFEGIPEDKIDELKRAAQGSCDSSTVCHYSDDDSLIPDSEDTELRCSMALCRRRRFALGNIFINIPQEKVRELSCDDVKRCDSCLVLLSECSCSTEDTLIQDNEDVKPLLNEGLNRRRCALADIFAGVPVEEVAKLLSVINNDGSNKDNESEDGATCVDNVRENNDCNTYVRDTSEHGEKNELKGELEDCQSDTYMDTFFKSLLEQQHRQGSGYLVRAMSMPCYSQYDLAQQLSSDKRRNGQWDILSDITWQDYYSLKGQYVSTVVFASC